MCLYERCPKAAVAAHWVVPSLFPSLDRQACLGLCCPGRPVDWRARQAGNRALGYGVVMGVGHRLGLGWYGWQGARQKHYLPMANLPVAEISLLMGFEAPNSFFPALRGWCGQSPARFREAFRALFKLAR